MRWTCLAIHPPRGFAGAPIQPAAGGCFSIPARISAAAGAPWKPAALPTRCSAIAKVDERLLVLALRAREGRFDRVARCPQAPARASGRPLGAMPYRLLPPPAAQPEADRA